MPKAPKSHSWTITADQADMRLDHFLTHETEKTRSSLQNAIKKGLVLVNDEKPTVHRFLKAGDTVIYTPEVKPTAVEKAKQKADSGESPLPALKEILIDTQPDYYVINKPAGLMVHPDNKGEGDSLVDVILAAEPSIAKVGEEPQRPGIVHRLDRDVSGLMLVARTQKGYDALKEAFAQRHVKKTYITLVHGALPHDEDDVKFRIARSTSKARMAALPQNDPEGKAAWTHYRVLKRFRVATLAEIDILSGRTHQIRAHMHALGCPVIGDMLYTIKKTEHKTVAPRLLLQSIGLSFPDPMTGEQKTYTIEVDPAFEKAMSDLAPSA